MNFFNGYNYTEGASSEQDLSGRKRAGSSNTFSRSQFAKSQVVFDLSSFVLAKTDKNAFSGNRLMRNISELESDMDSVDSEILEARLTHYEFKKGLFTMYGALDTISLPDDLRQYKASRKQKDIIPILDPGLSNPTPVTVDTSEKVINVDSNRFRRNFPDRSKFEKGRSVGKGKVPSQNIAKSKVETTKKIPLTRSKLQAKVDSVFNTEPDKGMFENAANKARSAKSRITGTAAEIKDYSEHRRVFQIQWNKILASSFACIAMFLIGAPLGAIIKKGGLGVPFLVSIMFFIIYYLLTMQGEKWAKKGAIPVPVGVWAADLILFVIGIYFLRQARLDARFFEADYYLVKLDNIKKWLAKRGLFAKQAS